MKANILVADDQPANLRLLVGLLKEQGYKVRPALSGKQALAVAQNEAIDVILLDIMMPDMDGYEVCKHLQADERTRDIPVIFLSALNETFDKVKAFDIGGMDYITKPFQEEEVLARVKTQLTLRQQQLALRDERERFQQLADAAFEGILIHERGEILDVNHTLVEMFGYDCASDLIGKNAFELISPPSDKHAAAEAGDESPYETQAVKQNGAVFPVEIRTRSISWQGRAASVKTIRDMSVSHMLDQEARTFRIALEGREQFGRLVGKSPAMKRVYELILRASATDAPVVIYGETGTGKELAARTIFEMSTHHTARFVPVNCASIPESLFENEFFGHRKGAFTGANRDHAGYFEQAHGGTLFLDEVGELSLLMQAKLLRVLEDRTYTPVGAQRSRTADVRIIAATNRELRSLAQQGKIRSDFFHRLHVLAIDLPPLRWRKEDIPLLIAHFLQRQREAGNPPRIAMLPPALLERFSAYEWPGNVRELLNEAQRYLTVGEVELSGHLPDDAPTKVPGLTLPDDLSLNDVIEQVEQYYIPRVLQRCGGNKTQAATILGLNRRTLYRKLEKYGIERS